MDCYEFEYLDEVKPTFSVPPPVGVITRGESTLDPLPPCLERDFDSYLYICL
jgi:hypothetical protein